MATALKNPKPPVKSARALADEWLATYAELGAELDRLDALKKPLKEQQDELRAKLREWADDPANDAEFASSETIRLNHGSFGYRNGVEKLEFDLDHALPEPQRTAQIVGALQKQLPAAVKVSYDEKYIAKGWDMLPKLRAALAGLVLGVKRERVFVVVAKRVAVLALALGALAGCQATRRLDYVPANGLPAVSDPRVKHEEPYVRQRRLQAENKGALARP